MAQKKVVSIRLAEEQVEYLARTARRLGRTPSQTAAMLLDESLRRERFPDIEIRETLSGRTAYIRGTRLPVWMVVSLVRAGETVEEIAEDRRAPLAGLRAALAYAETFPEEIEFEFAMIEEFRERPEKYLPGVAISRQGESAS